MFKILSKMLMVVGLVLGAFNYYLVLTTGRSMFTDLALQAPQLPDLPTLELPSFENPIADLLKSDDAQFRHLPRRSRKFTSGAMRTARSITALRRRPPPAGGNAQCGQPNQHNPCPGNRRFAQRAAQYQRGAPRTGNPRCRRIALLTGVRFNGFSNRHVASSSHWIQRYQDQQRVIEETQ